MIKNNLNFIGGQYVPSSSDETLDVLNPTTGEVVGTIPAGTTEDAQMALDSASAAQKLWAKRTARERAGLLRKFAQAIRDKKPNWLPYLWPNRGS